MSWQKNLQKYAERQGRKALENVAKETESQAKALAPVKTGALRNSIKATVFKHNARIGSDLPYAYFVEMGTRHMAPKSFLRRGLEKAMSKFKKGGTNA